MKGVGLLLFHPRIAAIDCADCCRRMYDMESGTPKTFKSGPEREIRYYDGPDHKPPCRTGWACPKGSPEESKDFELSEKNRRMMLIYRHYRATNGFSHAGANAGEPIDPLLADNLALIDGVYREWERTKAAEENGRDMAMNVLRLLKR